MQPASDHQVQNKKTVAIERPNNAFADPGDIVNLATLKFFERRIEGTNEKRTDDVNLLERLFFDATLEVFDIDGDVRKFGHPSARPASGPRENCPVPRWRKSSSLSYQ